MRMTVKLSTSLFLALLATPAFAADSDNLNDDIRFSRDLARFRLFDLAVEWLADIEKQGGLSEDNRMEVSLAKATVAELASEHALTRAERMKYYDESIAHYEAAIASMGGMSTQKAQATADGLSRVLISKGNFYINELARLRALEADEATMKTSRENAEAAFKEAVKTLNTVYVDITDYVDEQAGNLPEEEADNLTQLALYALYRKGESYYHWAMLYQPQEFNREDYLNKCQEALTDYIWEAGDGGIFPMLAYYFQGMAAWEIGKIQADKAAEQDHKALDQLSPIYGEFGINEDQLKEMGNLGDDERSFVLSVLERAYRGVAEIYRAAANRIEQSSTIAADADLTDLAFGYRLTSKSNAYPDREWLTDEALDKATMVTTLRQAAVGMINEIEGNFDKYRLKFGEEGYRAQLEKSRALVDLGRGGQALSLVKDIAQKNDGKLVGMEANALLSELLDVTDQGSQPADVWMMAGDGAYGEERWLDAIDAYHKAIDACASDDERTSFQGEAWRRIAESYQRIGRNLEAAMAFDAGYNNSREIGDEANRDELALASYNAWNRRYSESRSDFDEKQRNRIRDEVTRLGISDDIQFLVAREAFVNASAIKDPAERKQAFRAAIKEFDGVAEASVYFERSLVYKARCYAEADDPDNAVKTFDQLLARIKDPTKKVNLDKKKTQQREIAAAEATYYKAGVLLDQEKHADVLSALEGYESTYEKQTGFFPSVNYNRVKSLVALGRLEDAEQLVGSMKANFAKSNMTTYALSQVASGHYQAYQALGDEEKEGDKGTAHLRSAAEYLGEYNRLTGYGSFANMQNVADWYKAIGELKLAEEDYLRILDKYGKTPKYQKDVNSSIKRSLAEVQLDLGKFQEALPLWRDVYAGSPRNRDITRNLALCLGGWLQDERNDRGLWDYQEIPGAGNYNEALDLWAKLKDGIEAADEKYSDDWWNVMTNYIYCLYMDGKSNPQAKVLGQKYVNQWKALHPELGGEPHKRRLNKLERALGG